MKLIFMYGPPAVGKTTIGAELAKLTGYRFFFNHLTVPAAKALFPDIKDASARKKYHRLLQRLRLDVIETAAEDGLSIIFTMAYQGAVDDDFVGEIVNVVTAGGGEVCFVQLTASERDLLDRVGDKSRKDLHMGKITTPEQLKEALVPGMFETVKYANVLKIDTTTISIKEASQRIARCFHLI